MTATPQDAFLSLNGFRLHYLDWGGEGQPTVLMVHGLTRQAHAFDGLAARLAGRYRCLAIDVRGRGESEWTPPETYHYRQYTDDVAAFADALGLERFHYVGTSMGGHIGMHLAARQPERFLSLVLNDIAPETAQGGSTRIQQFVSGTPARLPSFEACVERETERFPWTAHLPRAELEAAVRHQVRRHEDGSWAMKYDPQIIRGRLTDPEARRQAGELMWQGFRALRVPILLVLGAITDLVDPAVVRAMQEAQPTMRVATVPGVGHAPSLNEPEAVAALAVHFG
jgi:pimeloyl-ACP methyl ester carboxylesterase